MLRKDIKENTENGITDIIILRTRNACPNAATL
jgi:hypothetical protein